MIHVPNAQDVFTEAGGMKEEQHKMLSLIIFLKHLAG